VRGLSEYVRIVEIHFTHIRRMIKIKPSIGNDSLILVLRSTAQLAVILEIGNQDHGVGGHHDSGNNWFGDWHVTSRFHRFPIFR
jgi:hypothetical protein